MRAVAHIQQPVWGNHMSFKSLFVSAAGAALMFGAAAVAQPAEYQMQQPGAAAETPQFTDAQIEAYANAVTRVSEITSEWLPRMDAAENDQARMEIQQEMQEPLVAAVEAEGLSAQEYNEITFAAQNDPALAQRISALLE